MCGCAVYFSKCDLTCLIEKIPKGKLHQYLIRMFSTKIICCIQLFSMNCLGWIRVLKLKSTFSFLLFLLYKIKEFDVRNKSVFLISSNSIETEVLKLKKLKKKKDFINF